VNDELKGKLAENDNVLVNVLFWNLPDDNDENYIILKQDSRSRDEI
jgi:hypothetical protein